MPALSASTNGGRAGRHLLQVTHWLCYHILLHFKKIWTNPLRWHGLLINGQRSKVRSIVWVWLQQCTKIQWPETHWAVSHLCTTGQRAENVSNLWYCDIIRFLANATLTYVARTTHPLCFRTGLTLWILTTLRWVNIIKMMHHSMQLAYLSSEHFFDLCHGGRRLLNESAPLCKHCQLRLQGNIQYSPIWRTTNHSTQCLRFLTIKQVQMHSGKLPLTTVRVTSVSVNVSHLDAEWE